MKKLSLFLGLMLACSVAYGQQNIRIQSSDGRAISSTNPLAVTVIGGGSSVDLSAIDQGIYPDTTNTYDIGSATYAWKDIHADGTIYGGDFQTSGTGNSRLTFSTGEYIDGSTADITFSDSVQIDTALYVLGVGNTGIGTGTTAPTQKLHVVGNVMIDGQIYTDDSIYGTSHGVNWEGIATCGCKKYINGVCVILGTCS